MYILGSPFAFLCPGMLTWCLPRSLAPIAWPIAKLLDYVLGVHSAHTYKKAELKSFLQFHRTGEEPLRDDEISILNGVLELNTKNVEQIMTPIEVCYHCTLPVQGRADWCYRMLFHLARIPSWIRRLSISCKFLVTFMLLSFLVTVHFQHVKWLLPFPDSRTRETVQLSRIIIDQEGDFSNPSFDQRIEKAS